MVPDGILGGLAVLILLGGLWMVFTGARKMGEK